MSQLDSYLSDFSEAFENFRSLSKIPERYRVHFDELTTTRKKKSAKDGHRLTKSCSKSRKSCIVDYYVDVNNKKLYLHEYNSILHSIAKAT